MWLSALLSLCINQCDAVLQGTVQDSGGRPIAGAAISLDIANREFSGFSDGRGRFTFVGLPSGHYAFSAVKRTRIEKRVTYSMTATGVLKPHENRAIAVRQEAWHAIVVDHQWCQRFNDPFVLYRADAACGDLFSVPGIAPGPQRAIH